MMMVYGMFVFELKTLPHQQLHDAPRDKCAPFREINGIAAAFQYSQKNYNPTASSFL